MSKVVIPLRRVDTCSLCGAVLAPSTLAYWDRATKTVTCLDCGADQASTGSVAPSSSDPLSTPSTTERPESGHAGASAQKEFDRRHEKREEVLEKRFGRFAGVVKFLVDDPQSTKAWAKGSQGERELAEALTRRVGDRAVLLHDRKIPKSSANIDLLAVASSGVWIIDAKKYSGRLQRRDKGGWRTIDYRVYVAGRDRSKLAEGLHKQEAVVRKALGETAVPVHTVLCFIGVEWDFFLKPFQVNGVWITYGKKLAEMIAEPGSLEDSDVLEVANALALALPAKET